MTARQQEVLDAIIEFIRVDGLPPTVRELGQKFGFHNQAVTGHLKALRAKGRVTWIEGKARTLRVVEGAP